MLQIKTNMLLYYFCSSFFWHHIKKFHHTNWLKSLLVHCDNGSPFLQRESGAHKSGQHTHKPSMTRNRVRLPRVKNEAGSIPAVGRPGEWKTTWGAGRSHFRAQTLWPPVKMRECVDCVCLCVFVWVQEATVCVLGNWQNVFRLKRRSRGH